MDAETILRFRDCSILREGRLIREDLWIRNGKVLNPEPLFFDERRSADIEYHCPFIIAPGFLDVQINGGYGVDFSSCNAETIVEGISVVRKNLVQHGVTSFCPTIVTSSPALYHELLPHIKRNKGGKDIGAEILGLHLEGPFINRDKKGAHRLEHVRSEVDNGSSDLESTYGDLTDTSIITIAPELSGCMQAIEEISKRGIVVSLGHSSADISLAQEAVSRGARCMTHLFNAMPPFHHREPGMIGLIVQSTSSKEESSTVFYGLIADGVHTHPASLKIAYSANPAGAVLVSDAISATGLEEGVHQLGEYLIEMRQHGAYVAGTNTLCGSTATLDICVRYFWKATDCSVEEALEAASLHPAQLLRVDAHKGTLNFAADADFVVLDKDLQVLATFIAGECVYKVETFSMLEFSLRK